MTSVESIKNILNTFEEDVFYVDGKFEKNVSLFFKDKINDKAHCINFPSNVENDEYRTLVENCSASGFGHGSKFVIDNDYRFAYSMENDQFASNIDIGNLTKEIQSVLSPDENISIVLDKLNVYTPGGEFKQHKDTPDNSNMFGTLVIALPSKFEGGEFVFEKSGKTYVFDWAVKSDSHVQWLAFYGDVTHCVYKVTSGYRITVTYKLYWNNQVNNIHENKITSQMQDDFINLLHNIAFEKVKISEIVSQYGEYELKEFKPDKIGFGCAYMYSKLTPQHLKGKDKIFYDFMNQLHLSPSLKEYVYDEDENEVVVCEKCKKPFDEMCFTYEYEMLGIFCQDCYCKDFKDYVDEFYIQEDLKCGHTPITVVEISDSSSIKKICVICERDKCDHERLCDNVDCNNCHIEKIGRKRLCSAIGSQIFEVEPNSKFKRPSTDSEHNTSRVEFLEENYCESDDKIFWINKPNEGTHCATGSFMYGNYPASFEDFYKYGAMIVDVNIYKYHILMNLLSEISNKLPKDIKKIIIDLVMKKTQEFNAVVETISSNDISEEINEEIVDDF